MCACRGTAGFAHVSCLAEQAKILVAEGEDNNLDYEVMRERWKRWFACSLCEQNYHGVVKCALGWACWKTYVGRPETDVLRETAMRQLGTGLHDVGQFTDALLVKEAELSTLRRNGASGEHLLATQGNLAMTYAELGRTKQALQIEREVYFGHLKLKGEEHFETLQIANNYATTLLNLQRYGETKSLLRKTVTVAHRVLGADNRLTLMLRLNYTVALCRDAGATLDDLREALNTLEEIEPTARRVFGGAHPLSSAIERDLRVARAVLRARETPSPGAA